MNGLIDIWPKGVGYDTLSGYNVEKYDSKKDPIERVTLLVDSWRRTALDHNFASDTVRTLSCQQIAGGHQLTFLNPEKVILKGQLHEIKVDADVDEDPTDTCVSITILGKNLDTEKEFSFRLTVYRRPQIKSSTKYDF